jgi:hypothetical protein
MPRFIWRNILPCFMLVSAPLLVSATGPEAAFSERLLAGHNRERANLGLPPMRWNSALAASAQKWAATLAVTGRFEHARIDPRDRDPQGENLWAGTRGYFTPEDGVKAWLAERRNFAPGSIPAVSTTGRFEDVGHYTQIVWRYTREAGCAMARSPREDILVCRYAEAGNVIGEKPY